MLFLCMRNHFENTGLSVRHFHQNKPGHFLALARAHRPVLVLSRLLSGLDRYIGECSAKPGKRLGLGIEKERIRKTL